MIFSQPGDLQGTIIDIGDCLRENVEQKRFAALVAAGRTTKEDHTRLYFGDQTDPKSMARLEMLKARNLTWKDAERQNVQLRGYFKIIAGEADRRVFFVRHMILS